MGRAAPAPDPATAAARLDALIRGEIESVDRLLSVVLLDEGGGNGDCCVAGGSNVVDQQDFSLARVPASRLTETLPNPILP